MGKFKVKLVMMKSVHNGSVWYIIIIDDYEIDLHLFKGPHGYQLMPNVALQIEKIFNGTDEINEEESIKNIQNNFGYLKLPKSIVAIDDIDKTIFDTRNEMEALDSDIKILNEVILQWVRSGLLRCRGWIEEELTKFAV